MVGLADELRDRIGRTRGQRLAVHPRIEEIGRVDQIEDGVAIVMASRERAWTS